MISLTDELDIIEEVLNSLEPEDSNSPGLRFRRGTPKPWWAVLPEETRYRDTGCDLHPSCLNCPLPHCVEDSPRGRQNFRQRQTAATINSLLGQGHTHAQIARLLGVSTRTIRRYRNTAACGQPAQEVRETHHLSQRRTK